jgi:hypothetical protein
MRRIFCVVLSTAMAFSGHALGDAPSAAAKESKAGICLFPNSHKRAPVWVCKPQARGWAVTAVGSAAKSEASIAFMEQQAAADARTKLARRLRGGTTKKITGSDGAVTTETTHESLRGTRILKSVYGPDGTLYVLVGHNGGGANGLKKPIAADEQKSK